MRMVARGLEKKRAGSKWIILHVADVAKELNISKTQVKQKETRAWFDDVLECVQRGLEYLLGNGCHAMECVLIQIWL